MTDVLIAVAEGRVMGELRRDECGRRLAFVHDDDWRATDGAYPLSLSMTLAAGEHGEDVVEPWLWGLMPEDRIVLDHWGKRFHVSLASVFGLLREVGEDCAGGVRFVRPERVDKALANGGPHVERLTEADVAERLRMLARFPAASRAVGDRGRFTLAGAQPKTALFLDDRGWGVPHGPTPTTHILKPPHHHFDGLVENEHLCLELARALGLPVARSEIRAFEGETAIVVERHDRVRDADGVRRVHQEDFCQALGVRPALKCQNEGGPTCGDIAAAIRAHSTAPEEDAWTFARATMLNWLIGGTDAHAKNFSMLIGAGGAARLAPLYDIASILPYGFDVRRLKLANRIGGKYRLADILARHWARFASEVGLPAAEVLNMGKIMAEAVPGALARVIDEARAGGLDHPVMERMNEAIGLRARRCLPDLSGPPE